MQLFWVEGLLAQKAGAGKSKPSGIKPYSASFWANTAQEAVQMALSANPRARWLEGPTVSDTSEEMRMRAMGAPELPGLETPRSGKKTSKRKI